MNLIFTLNSRYLTTGGYLKPFFHGIGDVINGIAYCLDYCFARGVNFKISVNSHQAYLDFFNFSNFLYPKTNNIPTFFSSLEEFKVDADVFVFVVPPPSFNVCACSNKTKSIIKKIFFSNPLMDFSKYRNILHVRSGDYSFVDKTFLDYVYLSDGSHPFSPCILGDIMNDEDKAELILNYLKNNCPQTEFDLLISDNLNLKEKISQETNIPYFNAKPNHFGFSIANNDQLKNTVIEFQSIFYCDYVLSIGSFPFSQRKSSFASVPSSIGCTNTKYACLNVFQKKIVDI